MEKSSIRINKKRLWYTFLILPFCLPELIYFNSLMSVIMRGWKITVVLYAAMIFFGRIKKYKMQDWCILLLLIEFFLVSLMNGVVPITTSYLFAIYILFENYTEKDGANFLISCIHIFEVIIIINLITVLLYPDGMYSTIESGKIGYAANWFLGYKNPMVRVMLPACAFSHIYSLIYDERRKWKAWALTIVSLITVILVNSMAGLLGMLVLLFFILMSRKGISKMVEFWSLTKSFITLLVIDVLIVGLRKQVLFKFIIESILQRSTDNMTGRTTIWDVSIDLISESPLFGYGESASDVMLTHIYASHPHNYVLYVLLLGGGGALILLMLIVYKENSSLKQITNQNVAYGGIILGTITAFWVIGVAESLTGTFFLYPMFIFCHKNLLEAKEG